jgi:CRISPR-associated protein Cmr4
MSTHLVLVHALSPIHCGTGQAISGIDLPIAREKHTGTPLIPGSTLKGVLRAQSGGYEVKEGQPPVAKGLHLGAFGPDTDKATEHAGAVQFGDLHLVFLPIRSVRGTFAWVTSPNLIRRLSRELKETNHGWKIPSLADKDEEAQVSGDRLIVKVGDKERVVFEDFDFTARKSPELKQFASQFGEAVFGKNNPTELEHFAQRVCVVSDDVMRILGRVGMEITARNRINNETKTVAKGALWTEEALPSEAILAGVLVATAIRKEDRTEKLVDHVRSLCSGPIQLGGKATVGRGLCRLEVR